MFKCHKVYYKAYCNFTNNEYDKFYDCAWEHVTTNAEALIKGILDDQIKKVSLTKDLPLIDHFIRYEVAYYENLSSSFPIKVDVIFRKHYRGVGK
ncbi:MAG: hypothetical protein KBT03_13200 [Bacteroidales bacterium]|nr:hypothetical protein [Candidatus Scybalousia scybalohippi]